MSVTPLWKQNSQVRPFRPGFADKRRKFTDRKNERFLDTRTMRGEARYDAFRPYQVKRSGLKRLGAYDMARCSQSCRDSELVEAFFHAQEMTRRGFYKNDRGGWTFVSPAERERVAKGVLEFQRRQFDRAAEALAEAQSACDVLREAAA